ncbi:MAG: BrnT family toxin [Thermodesulfovibrionia bacterium]
MKHKVSFELTGTVFKDPRAISKYDDEHSGDEDRWITLGLASNGFLLTLHHTFEQIDKDNVTIRIISSRKATKNEKKQYMEL